jgi:hypothetical protein
LGLRQFGNFDRIKLEPPPPVEELVRLAVIADETFPESGMELETAVEVRVQFKRRNQCLQKIPGYHECDDFKGRDVE